ncbi:hypothetical protein CDEST_07680 [Colletotrichum destructivum]|uniref:Uncharacterized protein n=1 Tax=Colletotrichum destructivum TaxID=34406 RepID=A0AAX4IHU7_9PEZI|nr:hypothetical protein CDEST_07680 [Colletotrichum destructivum]
MCKQVLARRCVVLRNAICSRTTSCLNQPPAAKCGGIVDAIVVYNVYGQDTRDDHSGYDVYYRCIVYENGIHAHVVHFVYCRYNVGVIYNRIHTRTYFVYNRCNICNVYCRYQNYQSKRQLQHFFKLGFSPRRLIDKQLQSHFKPDINLKQYYTKYRQLQYFCECDEQQ